MNFPDQQTRIGVEFTFAHGVKNLNPARKGTDRLKREVSGSRNAWELHPGNLSFRKEI